LGKKPSRQNKQADNFDWPSSEFRNSFAQDAQGKKQWHPNGRSHCQSHTLSFEPLIVLGVNQRDQTRSAGRATENVPGKPSESRQRSRTPPRERRKREFHSLRITSILPVSL
jgi:hypothetical protein